MSQNGLYTIVDAKLCLVAGFILWAYDFIMKVNVISYLILRCLFRRDGIIFSFSFYAFNSSYRYYQSHK